MALGNPTLLTTGGSGTNATDYDSGVYTPPTNELILACVSSGNQSGSSVEPTGAGNSLTWVVAGTILFGGASDFARRITLFRALGTGTNGATTFDFGTDTQLRCGWWIGSISGIDTSGTNGSGAIAQVVTDSVTSGEGDATTISVAYGAFGDTGNLLFSFAGIHIDEAMTVQTNWTELLDVAVGAEAQRHQVQYINPRGSETVCSSSWTTGTRAGIIGVEIVVASGAPPASNAKNMLLLGVG